MILLIDLYDSFSNSLAALVEKNSGLKVVTIYNDSYSSHEYETFAREILPHFQYIVIGPGPGHPANEKDVGIIKWLFERHRSQSDIVAVPILGICLGFQCMCLAFGGEIVVLDDIKHGQVYPIHLYGLSDLLGNESEGISEAFDSVRYHSLAVSSAGPNIVPLAYCCEGDDARHILMAGKHRSLPFYGVQYHPESICSQQGATLIKRFTQIAKDYNAQHRPESLTGNFPRDIMADHAVHSDHLIPGGKFERRGGENVHIEKANLSADTTCIGICEYLRRQNQDFILLNSAAHPGQYSIVGLPIKGQSLVLTHSVDEPKVYHLNKVGVSDSRETHTIAPNDSIWNVIGRKMKQAYISRADIEMQVKAKLGDVAVPFFGGFMGLVAYEEGQFVDISKLELLCRDNKPMPDIKLVFVERCIVQDHRQGKWYIISTNSVDSDEKWVVEFSRELGRASPFDISNVPHTVSDLCRSGDVIKYDLPCRETYTRQFQACQEYLHSGDSYELCLTMQLKLWLPQYIDAWTVYKILTLHKNPAPFSCFMEFDDCTLISSSPERFLSCTDQPSGEKMVELRPIKGTVKKTLEVGLAEASAILKTPKEIGENLMIVDLIRHDLYRFTRNVSVPQLMVVEEYRTVFQLVSVIQGLLLSEGYHGIDVLVRSLPPGLMTGAPKKRSVELLQEIESMQATSIPGGRRGVYSGVAGYWLVTDEMDWLVIIRSVYHYNNDKENTNSTKLWRIGAGGAITVLSTANDEWEEMLLKLSSALQAFT